MTREQRAVYAALDMWARVKKQYLPMEHPRWEYVDKPAIHGGGVELRKLPGKTYTSGDYETWPSLTPDKYGARAIDPLEFALGMHYDDVRPDRLAGVPSGRVRQKRARDPHLDGQKRIPQIAVDVYAHVDKALARLAYDGILTTRVFHAVFHSHPRHPDDPLNEGKCPQDRKVVNAWYARHTDEIHRRFGVRAKSPKTPEKADSGSK